MYLADPAWGRRRRSVLRDKARSVVHEGEVALERAVRDLGHRVSGRVAEARSLVQDDSASDRVIAERVRARIGRLVSHPHAISSTVEGGRVILTGDLLRDELGMLYAGLSGVRGVRAIEQRLELYAPEDRVATLTGDRKAPRPRYLFLLNRRWSPASRLIAAALGAPLALTGGGRRGLAGLVLRLLGAGLTARALSHTSSSPLEALSGRPIELGKTVHIRAPLEEVFACFKDFRNFSRFMSHVKRVQLAGEGRSHWVVAGPAGTRVVWDAELTELVPNQRIAWRTLSHSDIRSTGRVTFAREADGRTRVQVQLSYHPPAGPLGHFVARLFGKDPKRALDDDLLRLQSLLEKGTATGLQGKVHREDLLPSS
jgi:uncharacterized membrane protein